MGITKRIFVGFDGYIDVVQKIVSSGSGENRQYFETIAEYADTLRARAGKNGDFEVVTQSRRVGGNAPILALAAARLGAGVDCVSSMGEKKVRPPFDALVRAGVQTVSLCAPCMSYVFEFFDGKLMYGENVEPLPSLALLLEKVGEPTILKLLQQASVVALVDYANLPQAAELWRGVKTLMCKLQDTQKRDVFMDVADISHFLAPNSQELTELIKDFGQSFPVHLGLNHNEAEHLCKSLSLQATTPREAARGLHKALGVCVVLHTQAGAVYCAEDGEYEVCTQPVLCPKATVGAGDHFNAGYCVALLKGLSPLQRLHMASAEATQFVATGKDPTLESVFPIE